MPSDRDRASRPAATPDRTERRSRLRQYQVQLLERMQAAKHGTAAGTKELGVMIGHERCLLELSQVGEIAPARSITQVPLAQEWYLGLANIRGNLMGIIDLARYQGAPSVAIGPDSRVVTFAAGLGFNCALLVARVLGLRDLAEMEADPEADPDPEAGAGAAAAAPWSQRRMRDRSLEHWARIDLAQLVLDPRFLQVGL